LLLSLLFSYTSICFILLSTLIFVAHIYICVVVFKFIFNYIRLVIVIFLLNVILIYFHLFLYIYNLIVKIKYLLQNSFVVVYFVCVCVNVLRCMYVFYSIYLKKDIE